MLPKLTPSESKLLALLAEGHNAESIANQLGLAIQTVKNRKGEMLRKCGQSNSISMIRMFYDFVPKRRARRKVYESQNPVV